MTSEIRIFTKQELVHIFESTAQHPCGLALRLIHATGLRGSEALRLRPCDFNFPELSILVLPDRKRKARRTVYFPERLRYPLLRLILGLGPEDFVFAPYGRARKPFSTRMLQSQLAQCGRGAGHAGVTGYTVDSLRATHVVELLRMGVDPKQIMKNMGLMLGKSIRRYRNLVSPEEIRIPFPAAPEVKKTRTVVVDLEKVPLDRLRHEFSLCG